MKRPADFNPHDNRNTRQCRKCDQVKSVAEFPWCKAGNCYERQCYECKRRQNNERNAGLRRDRQPQPDAWTAEEIAKLRECAYSGTMTPREAALAIGRSYAATTRQRSRQGLPRFKPERRSGPSPTWPAERLAHLKQLRDRGLPFSKCAAILRTQRNAAIGAAHRYLKEEARP